MNSICGIDFGTSNSTLGIIKNNQAQLLPLEGEEPTLPSTLFFNLDENQTSYGRAAINGYIEGDYGRFMRSLKSILGTSLMKRATQVKQRQLSYSQIIGEFIGEMKHRAESQLDAPLEYVVAGRPVHFVDDNPSADAAAQEELKNIYHDVGFKHVEFQFEPIAAALNYEQQLQQEELALIVDIGGGTSDFTIIRLNPANRQHHIERHNDILATHGVHIGGNDFDRRFNLVKAMPALGFNSLIKGPSQLKVPSSPYFDLATWHLIHNQYERSNIHLIESLLIRAEQPELIERLVKVLKNQDGHLLISKIEACKIALANQLEAELDLGFIENTLTLPCHRDEFNAATHRELDAITQAITESLQRAQLSACDISSVFLTGGTTGLPAVQQAVKTIFPNHNLVAGDRYGSVGLGLTIDAQRRFLTQ